MPEYDVVIIGSGPAGEKSGGPGSLFRPPRRSNTPRDQAKLWRCQRCGRGFAKKNQWHSCLARTVDHHFRGKDPRLRQTYEFLIAHLRKLGPLRVDAVKTSINLVSKYHFGGVSVKNITCDSASWPEISSTTKEFSGRSGSAPIGLVIGSGWNRRAMWTTNC